MVKKLFYDNNNRNNATFLGNNVPTQLIPIAPFVLNIPGRNSSATVELIFLAEELPPLGYKAYHVTKKPGNEVVEGINIRKGDSLKAQAWVSCNLFSFYYLNRLKMFRMFM